MSVVDTVVLAVWLMLPAYLANSSAVVLGGGPPVDMGKEFGDARLLGDGKTWRGFFGGTLSGFVLAMIMNEVLVRGLLPEALPVLPAFTTLAALGLPAGALVGDMGASFLKRRTGRERGAPFPGVDQLDFVVGGFAVTLLLAPGWFIENFINNVGVLVVVAAVTPLLHISTNFIGYKIGVKDEPW